MGDRELLFDDCLCRRFEQELAARPVRGEQGPTMEVDDEWDDEFDAHEHVCSSSGGYRFFRGLWMLLLLGLALSLAPEPEVCLELFFVLG